MQTTHSLDAFGTRHPAVNAFSPSPGSGVALDGFSQSKQFNDVPVHTNHNQSDRLTSKKWPKLPLDVFETMIDIICELPLQQRRICLRALTTTNRATGAIAEQKLVVDTRLRTCSTVVNSWALCSETVFGTYANFVRHIRHPVVYAHQPVVDPSTYTLLASVGPQPLFAGLEHIEWRRQVTPAEVALLIQSPVRRLVVHGARESAQEQISIALLSSLRVVQLQELSLSYSAAFLPKTILAAPALGGLRSLRLTTMERFDGATVSIIGLLPSLEHLMTDEGGWHASSVSNPTLTELVIIGLIDEAPPPEFLGPKYYLRELKLSLTVADEPWRISPSALSLLLKSLPQIWCLDIPTIPGGPYGAASTTLTHLVLRMRENADAAITAAENENAPQVIEELFPNIRHIHLACELVF
ncbi:hypothetical protein B0H14DRAFT_3130534 [Mycena olivaceomarginata]|nr:hypothetical protein B0H14DRAFT_3130534 [Mycena olivaceomarginata]